MPVAGGTDEDGLGEEGPAEGPGAPGAGPRPGLGRGRAQASRICVRGRGGPGRGCCVGRRGRTGVEPRQLLLVPCTPGPVVQAERAEHEPGRSSPLHTGRAVGAGIRSGARTVSGPEGPGRVEPAWGLARWPGGRSRA